MNKLLLALLYIITFSTTAYSDGMTDEEMEDAIAAEAFKL